MSITRINEFTSVPGKSESLYIFLKSLIPYISSSEGCIACEVLRNTETENEFVVLEKWTSIDAHKQSIARFPKENMQNAMALIGAPPKGTYYLN